MLKNSRINIWNSVPKRQKKVYKNADNKKEGEIGTGLMGHIFLYRW